MYFDRHKSTCAVRERAGTPDAYTHILENYLPIRWKIPW